MESVARKPKGIDFWNAHLERFRSSGLSANAYCRQHNLTRSCFHARVRAGHAKVEQQQEAFVEITPSPCRVPATQAHPAIEVLSIRIPMGTPTAEIVNLIHALRECSHQHQAYAFSYDATPPTCALASTDSPT